MQLHKQHTANVACGGRHHATPRAAAHPVTSRSRPAHYHSRSPLCCHASTDNQDSSNTPTPSTSQQPQATPNQQQQQLFQDPPVLSAFLGTLFQQGALLGPMLDGIHSHVGLQVCASGQTSWVGVQETLRTLRFGSVVLTQPQSLHNHSGTMPAATGVRHRPCDPRGSRDLLAGATFARHLLPRAWCPHCGSRQRKPRASHSSGAAARSG